MTACHGQHELRYILKKLIPLIATIRQVRHSLKVIYNMWLLTERTLHTHTPFSSNMRIFFASVPIFLSLVSTALAFPAYGSLAGRTDEEIEVFVRTSTVPIVGAEPPPPVQSDTSAKLVADTAHPFKPAGSTDIRGPCPGLNTLASHGVSYNVHRYN